MTKKRHLLRERTAKGEKIGGGYIVVGRHTATGRVRVSPIGLPFEHPTAEAALREMVRLAEANPGKQFCVFAQIGTIGATSGDLLDGREHNDMPASKE